jgi:hypothetical protein
MKRKISALLLFSAALVADDQATHQLKITPDMAPWLTGPLLGRSAYTVQPPHWNVQPYLYLTVYTGGYTSNWKSYSISNYYSTILQFQIKRGLVNGLDFQFNPQVIYNEKERRGYCRIGDLPISFGIRLLDSKLEDRWPALKLTLRGNIPLGKYQHLNPRKLGTDSIGVGSWLPTVNLHLGKLWRIYGFHYLDMRLIFGYQMGTPVRVKGYNAYGGVSNTRGVIYPGNLFSVDWAVQYNFRRRWAFACDVLYQHGNRTRFSGNPGSTHGIKAARGSPSSEQFSLAPAIEYNWSQNIGLIGGVWFTFAGRNSFRTTSGVLSLNMYF